MEKQLVTVQNGSGALTAVDIRKQVNLIQEVMREVMDENVHYGKVPGCGDKPTLLKPGAEKIAMTFRLGCDFEELSGSIERDDFVCYKINCKLFYIPTGNIVGNGRGACNSKEKKYATRSVYANKATQEEKAIGKLETRHARGDSYDVYIIPNNPWDVQNTVMKMACKRAMVAAILNATGASDIFTQDIEDLPEEIRGTAAEEAAPSSKPHVEPPKSKSETQAATEGKPSDHHECSGCGAVISEKVKEYSMKHFSKSLCMDCQKRA